VQAVDWVSAEQTNHSSSMEMRCMRCNIVLLHTLLSVHSVALQRVVSAAVQDVTAGAGPCFRVMCLLHAYYLLVATCIVRSHHGNAAIDLPVLQCSLKL
jgi:hypothetical protein